MPKIIAEKSAIEIRRLTEPGMHAVGGVAGQHLLVSSTGAPFVDIARHGGQQAAGYRVGWVS